MDTTTGQEVNYNCQNLNDGFQLVLTTQAVDKMRLRHFVLGLAQAAYDGLQERVSVASGLCDHNFFQVIE